MFRSKKPLADEQQTQARQRAAQLFAAAPCPVHGQASLTLGNLDAVGNTLRFRIPEDSMSLGLREIHDLIGGEYLVSVACCECGRVTGTFVSPEKLKRYEP